MQAGNANLFLKAVAATVVMLPLSSCTFRFRNFHESKTVSKFDTPGEFSLEFLSVDSSDKDKNTSAYVIKDLQSGGTIISVNAYSETGQYQIDSSTPGTYLIEVDGKFKNLEILFTNQNGEAELFNIDVSKIFNPQFNLPQIR